ncbi:MAG: RagB/SusD family nutrient uptake outer membrane protein [Agriterribacter sp.]
MKYSVITKITAFILVMQVLSSCQKEKLNPISQTSLQEDIVFDTPERIEKQLNGLYSAVKSGNFYGGRYLIFNDIRGENFINEKSNGVTGLLVWNFTVTDGDTYLNRTWQYGYLAINKINLFLEGLDQYGNDIAGAELTKQYRAQAKFLRALSYYGLLQLYAPPYRDGDGSKKALPLRLIGIKGSGFNDQARSTVAEVYNQVIKDLDEAEADLPDDHGDSEANTVYAHKNSAIALKTKVYLSKGDYPKVINEANKIVSASAPFKTASGVDNHLESDIKNVFSLYTTPESIFSFPFTGLNENPGGQNQLGYYYNPDAGNGEYSLNSDGIVADADWKPADSRRSFIKIKGGKPWLDKYPGASPYIDWVPVLRYSEVLLNLAEAITRSTNTVDSRAVALLSAVRHRSDAGTTYSTADFADAGELAAAILKEREIEFLGEGIRSADILRLGLSFPAKGSVKEITPSSAGYIWPAPVGETQYNTSW